MKIQRKEFDLLRKQIYSLCGLIILDGKEYLIEHRFLPIFKEYNCSSWMQFYEMLCPGNGVFREKVVSAISTHETSFFRDNHPFKIIRNTILPELSRGHRPGRKVRIWCAAASTGQEPYSLAMLIHEFCKFSANRISPSDFSIVATDISEHVLEKARDGFYTRLETGRGLPEEYKKFFSPHNRGWKLNREVTSMVEFKKFNLLNSFGPLGKFDFVMCRNVLIYFDDRTKLDIVHRIHSIIPDDGYLMLGSTETLGGQTDRFVAEKKGPVILYRKAGRSSLRGGFK